MKKVIRIFPRCNPSKPSKTPNNPSFSKCIHKEEVQEVHIQMQLSWEVQCWVGQCPSGPRGEAVEKAAQTTEFVSPGRTSSFQRLWSCSRGGYRSPRGNAGVCGEQRYSPCLLRGGDRSADVRPRAPEAGLAVTTSRGGPGRADYNSQHARRLTSWGVPHCISSRMDNGWEAEILFSVNSIG